MRKSNLPENQMNASEQFCSNEHCAKRGLIGQGNIVVHSKKESRFRCKECRHTFAATTGTALFGLKKEAHLVETVLTLLGWGCPIQAIVVAFKLDERTVAAWRNKAGQHCHKVHQATVMQGGLEPVQIQADEIRVKGRAFIAWLAMAMAVPTRLWLGGCVGLKRDRQLIRDLMQMVVAACQLFAVVLVVTDGFAAYPHATRAAFRAKVPRQKGQRGRSRLVQWPGLLVGQVVKHTLAHKLLAISRTIVLGGTEQVARQISLSMGGTVLNTSYIERLNATFRQRIAVLGRRSRGAAHKLQSIEWSMWWCGTLYNFCQPHHSLRRLNEQSDGAKWVEVSPAMASGLTDHLWTVKELLYYRVVPPLYTPPKKRGRPPKLKQGSC